MKLVAFTTITLKGADGEDITISIEALDSTIPVGGETKLRVHVIPDKYVSRTYVQVTEGNVSGGSVVSEEFEEYVTLQKSNEDSPATGSLKYAPYGSVSFAVLSSIGPASQVLVSGNDCTASNSNTYALVAKAKYRHRFKEFKYTAPNNPKAEIVVAMGALNV